MALNPYSKINWQNAPSQDTPINATNLNKVDDQIYDVTDHLINLNASQISYSNTTSQLVSQTPQAAIDELAKPAFTQAGSRANIASGEKLTTILGKIKKYFADLKTVAFSGSYSDLSNKPSLAAVATSGAYGDLSGKPNLATVATSGSYSDLSGKPNLATVATSGSYNDLLNTPAIAWTHLSDTDLTAADVGFQFSLDIRYTPYKELYVLYGQKDGAKVKNAGVLILAKSITYNQPCVVATYSSGSVDKVFSFRVTGTNNNSFSYCMDVDTTNTDARFSIYWR